MILPSRIKFSTKNSVFILKQYYSRKRIFVLVGYCRQVKNVIFALGIRKAAQPNRRFGANAEPGAARPQKNRKLACWSFGGTPEFFRGNLSSPGGLCKSR